MSVELEVPSKILNGLSGGVVVGDVETRSVEWVNDSFCEMVGAERQELVGTNIDTIDAGPLLGEDNTPEQLIEQARTEGSLTFERHLKTQTGEEFPAEIHVSFLAEEDTLVATVQQVQARRDRQQRLRRYKRLVDQAPEMMIGLDTDGTFLFANDEFRRTHNIGEQSVAGLTVEDVLSPERMADPQPVLSNVLSGDTVDQIVQKTTGNGYERWYHIRSYPLDEPGEMDDSIVVTIDDITDQKKSEQTVRDQQAFIQSTIDALDDVLYVFDTDGSLVLYNDRLPEVTGYDSDELAEMQPWDFFPPDERPLIKHDIANVLHSESQERAEGKLSTSQSILG